MSNLNMSVQNAASASTEHRFPWRWYLGDIPAKKNGLKVFSCFSCGGGSSMGYKLAGYDVIGCCEIDPAMLRVYDRNNHPRYKFLADVREFAQMEDLPAELYELDVLDGSPPCSVFSMAGKREDGWNKSKKFREGQKDQRLDDLFFAFIEVAKKLQPKVVIAENVKGLVLKNARGYVNEIVKAFSDAGYMVQIFLLNSSRMGVPQSRERVFFIAQRKDYAKKKVVLSFNEKPITFGEVRTSEGAPVNEDTRIGELLKYIRPTDRDMRDVAKRIRRKNAYFSAQINHDAEPLHTITANGEMIRACDRTRLSKADIVTCQTFPQDYDFMDQNPQYICGMSVPPVMMANIAEEVRLQIFGGKNE